MKPVLTAEQMRRCDGTTIKDYLVPGLLLMEQAGRSVVSAMEDHYAPLSSKRIFIFCGKGNNGGDGFVAARLLSNIADDITVILLAPSTQLKGDAKVNFQILRQFAKKSSGKITIQKYSKMFLTKTAQPNIIVDAMFGTGFTGKVKRPYSEAIHWINNQKCPVMAVDIPSGVDGTTGIVENTAVHAHRTVTFGCLKSGLLCNQGRENAGVVQIADIGIPAGVLHHNRQTTCLLELSDIQKVMPKRPVHLHKYSAGKIFVIAGSKGLTGAAALCCLSALRAGGGAVVLGTPEPVYSILAKKLTETMVHPLPATNAGTLSLRALEAIKEKTSWADVVVLGPGLSQNPETQQLIIKIVMECRGKILIDADGLNALARIGISKLRSSRGQNILTPHVGEFSRLSKKTALEVEKNRIHATGDLSRLSGATVILKGVPTVIASTNGNIFLNSTGNPGMATAGSGDVLSGIIAGLWAQGMSDGDASAAGVYLHGLSGDIAAQKLGERSLVASDLIDHLPHALQTCEGGRNR